MDLLRRRRCMIHWCAILSTNVCLFHDSYLSQVRLFNFTADFGHVGAKLRKYQKTNGMLKADEPHMFGFPSCSPDFTISPHNVDASRSKLWRDRDTLGEVKPLKKQGPKSVVGGTSCSIPEFISFSTRHTLHPRCVICPQIFF